MATASLNKVYPKGVCGKYIFPTKKEAKKRKKTIPAQTLKIESGLIFAPYHCDKCKGWHLGHSIKTRPPAIDSLDAWQAWAEAV